MAESVQESSPGIDKPGHGTLFDSPLLHLFFFFFFCLLSSFRSVPMAYGVSQARGLIGAVTAGLCQRHSNARSELHMRPTPELMATPDP